MNIERIEYYIPLDIELVVREIFSMRIDLLPKIPAPEELITYIAKALEESNWCNPKHHLYDWLLAQANICIEAHTSKHSPDEE